MGMKPGVREAIGAGIWPKFTLKFWFLVSTCGKSAWPPSSLLLTRKATPWSRPFTEKLITTGSRVKSCNESIESFRIQSTISTRPLTRKQPTTSPTPNWTP
jgi:hypothetical protein